MKKVTRWSIPLVVVLLLLTLSGASQARPLEENRGSPPNTVLLGDTGNGNTIVFSVPGNSYEVALQVARSWGFRTLFVRNHDSSNQEHATYFYDVGSGAFRVTPPSEMDSMSTDPWQYHLNREHLEKQVLLCPVSMVVTMNPVHKETDPRTFNASANPSSSWLRSL